MNQRKILFTFVSAGVVAGMSGKAWSYVVRDGDTLSVIASEQISKKVYGEQGSLRKLMAVNPQIRNFNRIFPGDTINLPTTENKNELVRSEIISGPAASEIAAPIFKAPASVEEAETAEEKPATITEKLTSTEKDSAFEFTPRFFYSRLDSSEPANGRGASLISKLNEGLQFTWHQLWSESFESSTRIGLNKISFSDATSRTLENSTLTQGEFEAGARWHWNEKSSLLLGLGMGEEIFYRSTSATNVKIESIALPKLSVGFVQELYTRKSLHLGADLKLTALGGAKTDNYDIKNGWSYLGRISIAQQSKNSNWHFSTGLFYGQSFQNTSLIHVKRTDVGVDFGLSWSFGE